MSDSQFSIVNNKYCSQLIQILEATIFKLSETQKSGTNAYISNILGLYSHGENEKHKPNFLVWNLLRISTNILPQQDSSYLLKDKSLLSPELLNLSLDELYELAQTHYCSLLKQVYDCFKDDLFLLNCQICDLCNLRIKISSHKDYVSWSLLYALYNVGYISRIVKNGNSKRISYKWRKVKEVTFNPDDVKQMKIDYEKKISNAHYCAVTYLKQFGITDVVSEYKDKKCRDKKVLPFDIYFTMTVADNIKRIFIELDGEQHFKETIYSKGAKLLYIQKHDIIKTNFVIDSGDLIVRIPYSDNHKIKDIIYNIVNMKDDLKGIFTTKPELYQYLEIGKVNLLT